MVRTTNLFIHFFFIIALVSLGRTAIISGPSSSGTGLSNTPTVISLAKTIVYRITVNQTAKAPRPNLQAFVTISTSNVTCPAVLCHYIWLNNYTILNSSASFTAGVVNLSTPFIQLQINSNKTIFVIKNSQLGLVEASILELSLAVLNPLIPQFSNLNPLNLGGNNSTIFWFNSTKDIAGNKTLLKRLADQFFYTNYQMVLNSSNSNDTFLISANISNNNTNNTNTTFYDFLVLKNNTNIIQQRNLKMVRPQSTTSFTNATFVDDSVYMDLSKYQKLVPIIAANSSNVANFDLNASFVRLNLDKLSIYKLV